MTFAEWVDKWKGIPTRHDDDCPVRDGFDFGPCTCGVDELWRQRSADLQQVSDDWREPQ